MSSSRSCLDQPRCRRCRTEYLRLRSVGLRAQPAAPRLRWRRLALGVLAAQTACARRWRDHRSLPRSDDRSSRGGVVASWGPRFSSSSVSVLGRTSASHENSYSRTGEGSTSECPRSPSGERGSSLGAPCRSADVRDARGVGLPYRSYRLISQPGWGRQLCRTLEVSALQGRNLTPCGRPLPTVAFSRFRSAGSLRARSWR